MPITINAATRGTAEVLIYDEIGPQAAASLDSSLKAAGPFSALSIRINSPGGDVFQGAAIFTILSRVKARKTVYIDGLAASMASYIAMAGDRIIAAKNSMMMVHLPSALTAGDSDDLRRSVALLEGIEQDLIRVYAARTGQPPEAIRRLLQAETWLNAEQAVAAGFADVVEGEMQAAARAALASFDLSKFRHSPTAPSNIAELSAAYWRDKKASQRPATTGGDDISDLVPAPITAEDALKKFHGRWADVRRAEGRPVKA